MKVQLLIQAATVSITCAIWTATAADNKADEQSSRRQGAATEWSPTNRLERLGRSQKASDVIGMEVRNLGNEKIAKVDELALDLENGRVVAVILTSDGKKVAVPSRLLTSDREMKALRLNSDPEKLKGAPKFDPDKWSETFQANRVADLHHFYEGDRRFGSRVPGESMTNRLGHVEKASKLIGMVVRNLQDEKLGKVDNLLVNLAGGRVVQVVISSGGFLGLGDELSAVPPGALRFNSEKDELRLDITKEALANSPHFSGKAWPNFDDPVYAGQVYRSYRVEPYFSTNAIPDAANTRRNVRDRNDQTLTPADQGGNAGDVAITQRIRKEVLAADFLSVNAHNVKIITLNGKVTLRGPVRSADEKRTIGEIATRVAGAENVDNQIEVEKN